MFGQSFETHDLAIIAFLIVLEGVLSIDNALVLGLLAKRVPRQLQAKALTYGLVGALVFRVIAIATATLLIQIRWVKLVGGGYLVYVALKHFLFGESSTPDEKEVALAATHAPPHAGSPPIASNTRQFWMTVAAIELTDIAFAVDSILAAVGLVSGKDKTWVVVAGGFIGVILMRFAAAVFIKLLDRFPRFEFSAYLLVLVIGVKLTLDWYFNPDLHHPRLDFHSPRALVFWIFWGAMVASFMTGFIPDRRRRRSEAPQSAVRHAVEGSGTTTKSN